jgi:hypothetical protein
MQVRSRPLNHTAKANLLVGYPSPDIFEVAGSLRGDVKKKRPAGTLVIVKTVLRADAKVQVGSLRTTNANM